MLVYRFHPRYIVSIKGIGDGVYSFIELAQISISLSRALSLIIERAAIRERRAENYNARETANYALLLPESNIAYVSVCHFTLPTFQYDILIRSQQISGPFSCRAQ